MAFSCDVLFNVIYAASSITEPFIVSWILRLVAVTTCPGNTADMHIPSESGFVLALTMKTDIRVAVKGKYS